MGFNCHESYVVLCRGVATGWRGGRQGGHGSLTSTFEPKRIQHFQVQTSEILFFMSVQKLYVPEISRFLPCMLPFLENLWQITSHWTFWKVPILNAGPFEKFLIVDHPKEDHNERGFDYRRNPGPTGKVL